MEEQIVPVFSVLQSAGRDCGKRHCDPDAVSV